MINWVPNDILRKSLVKILLIPRSNKRKKSIMTKNIIKIYFAYLNPRKNNSSLEKKVSLLFLQFLVFFF